MGRLGSNQRPPACEAGALPAELRAPAEDKPSESRVHWPRRFALGGELAVPEPAIPLQRAEYRPRAGFSGAGPKRAALTAGFRALGAFEPRQVRKEAALRSSSQGAAVRPGPSSGSGSSREAVSTKVAWPGAIPRSPRCSARQSGAPPPCRPARRSRPTSRRRSGRTPRARASRRSRGSSTPGAGSGSGSCT